MSFLQRSVIMICGLLSGWLDKEFAWLYLDMFVPDQPGNYEGSYIYRVCFYVNKKREMIFIVKSFIPKILL